MTPGLLLRFEGAAVLAISVCGYRWSHGSWYWFALLFLTPDLSMAGYAINPRVGSVSYNAIHSYVAPLLLALWSLCANYHGTFALTLIWIAHIGFDRMLGYGLKYPTAFKDTHLNMIRHQPVPSGSAEVRS